MINRKQQDIARAINRARRSATSDGQRLGVDYTAHALADDLCTSAERYHFLLVCGSPFTLGDK